MMKDLYRNKDKLEPLLDKVAIFLSRMMISVAKASGNPIVMIPIHWAPDAFMSGKQFERYWWPSFMMLDPDLVRMILAAIISPANFAFLAIPLDPLANRPRAYACGFADSLRRLPIFDQPHNPLSTMRRQTGILCARSSGPPGKA
jgi:hypothetical protein